MSSKKQGSQFLKGLRNFRVCPKETSLVIEKFLVSLDCPRALTVCLLFRNNEHKQIADLGFDPSDYRDIEACRDAYAATKFLSKFRDLSLVEDLDKVAFTKFEEFETLCGQTNRRFRDLEHDPLFKGRVVWLHHAVIRKISRLLGDFSADEFFSKPDWGPGASTLIKRKDASSAKKFLIETGTTRDLYDLIPLSTLEGYFPLWAKQLKLSGYPTLQLGNKVITVPKDASTNRVIAIEPGINLWFQKSIGEMIGIRLRRCGVDLRFQSRNQELARVGSVSNSLATIDLSSASDSISSSVVEALLPPRWFHLMDACRSHYGTRNSQSKKWEKFSSMGNGFTFQLESLIFYAVAKCCAEYLHIGSSDVSAYGDDVILPSACFELFSNMMVFYGFRINLKKSHIDSPFRESCGAHYYLGIDVKPVYLKNRLSSVLSVYRTANALRRLAHRRNLHYGCDADLQSVYAHLVQLVPEALRLRIPADLGDGGFISNFDEATPVRARHGIEGFRVANVVEASKQRYDETEGYLLAALWSLPPLEGFTPLQMAVMRRALLSQKTGSGERHSMLKAFASLDVAPPSSGRNSVPVKERTTIRLAKSIVQQWYDLGPWL